MASSKKKGTPLVIVESPAKARTIGKFLGDAYRIEASIGHIRDLPSDASEVPIELKKEKWAKLGIDVEHDFKPLYVVPADKQEHLKKLRAAVKDASILYLATDEDREGESISWHLLQELAPKCEIKRLVFHEITKTAILEALQHPREIDMHLVEAQETRRLVDRLYGYTVSPLLWKKVRPKLSAGRVQSVAIRLIVERERERIRFRSAGYWSLEGNFTGDSGDRTPFTANLTNVAGARVVAGRDFDPDTGALKENGKGIVLIDEAKALSLAAELQAKLAKVISVEQKPYAERPYPPFTTSTLQQEAARKLRFAAQRTMRAAQRLYENGYITYMRTDSTTLSSQAITAARELIGRDFGKQYLPDAPRSYQTKVKNAQEAHEAIRPAGTDFQSPTSLAADVGDDERKLYELIWRRTVASQMKDAHGQRTSLTLEMDSKTHGAARFIATGKTIEFAGYRLAYVEDLDEAETELAESERVLPGLKAGQTAVATELKPDGHTTQPPPRVSEAGLIKDLEARGIGRPSTYASIIETIVRREYVFKRGSALIPTFTAFAVVELMSRHLGWLVDYQFTAKMEDDLDEISNGRARRVDYLKHFFLGNGTPGLRDRVTGVDKDIDPRVICSIPLGNSDKGELVEVRVGRYGPFISSGEQRTSVPDEMPPDEMTLLKALELLKKGGDGPKVLGIDPVSGLSVFVKVGRFGPYFQLGEAKDPKKDPKPKMASLLKDMDPTTSTLEQALAVLSLPRTVGVSKHPQLETDEPILASNGKFGPYMRWGKDTRTIPAEHTPLTIDLATALHLFAQPKTGGGGRGRTTMKALRELGPHPKSNATVKVMDGRYGPYVTDGTTNASLQKGEDAAELTMARAIELLAAREGAPKKPKRRATRRTKAAK
ncbi:MAG: type I DNA topoisomerase [Planctomycetota bacterium]|nr:type I DNA topoisomerase [Planctomycetota bacterium]